ncbi:MULTISPECIES: glutathione S-transferase [Caldimonas]|jgi:glutathione S-transferase|uniref:glutathione S-transferase family protein n=1 Tax=Caldimonas TaxID=196013 RepID=UPI00035ED776|nr:MULTISPECIES: glutathione S-transferase [Caldimonas]MCX7660530.1 glutathione S-transferase [Caldimonas manganoxidans]
MITVHHLNNSRSQRVLWMLEELQLPYEIRHYQRHPQTMLAPPQLRQVHPLGKSPVITDGELVLAESGAILEYLVDRYGQGRFKPAPGTPEALRYTFWMHFAEGSAMPPLVMKLVFDMVERKSPWLVRPVAAGIARKVKDLVVRPNIERHLEFMESELADRPWFAGDEFTAADVQMSFVLEASAARGGLDDRYPLLRHLLQRMQARPAYQRALAKGGPYQLG